ncbi:serine/threonine protein kinase [Arthrobacter sp. MYb227]|uniref:Stk1 family PASTA domain-containing Ser/Thr kinase n=1 Tax=Arthrobacter sp. MYb227 TaxID=1848601 RepID=UPI000CFAAFD0|nr:Stk1 family PASTA domain-containing Ser/Thr kinase [Arthrobacter sp. MYb227]PQZ90249.1 serine/threonine protein kinase [Arthrobacter sp. MYb227]
MSTERILDGRYIVEELIGRGGMADVHLGVDKILGRKVAIKLLRPEMARDPMVQTRFRREAKAVAGLNHPNIVSVFDTGEEEREIDGSSISLPYIVMEYVCGRTLRDMHKAGEITVELAIDYVLGVLEALAHSHSMGIVHRDIKPANIMVTTKGALKVMDFGIARAMADSSSTMTQTQTVVGTAQYLSPEQARGELVDARTDLYSTGCLLYELLTGRPPFIGDSPLAVAYQHVGEKADPPSAVVSTLPEIFDNVVLKALAKDREDRYVDAHAFAQALRNARNGIPLPAEQITELIPQNIPASLPQSFAAPSGEPAQMSATGHLDAIAPEESWDEDPEWQHDDPVPADPYRARSKTAWTVVISVFIVIALAVGGFFFYNWIQAEAARNALVTVPQLSTMTKAEAESTVRNLELVPRSEDTFDDSVKPGSVVSSDPSANTQVVKGSTVQLLISKGPENLKIPATLEGSSEATVRATLSELGFVVGNVTTKNDAQIPSGSLIETVPALGEQVKSGSSIDLIISTGMVTVPELIELKVPEATNVLTAPGVGLRINVVEEENEIATPGTIIDQSPSRGAAVQQGSSVTVYVAKAPVVEPPPVEEESPSEQPSTESSSEPSSTPGTKSSDSSSTSSNSTDESGNQQDD